MNLVNSVKIVSSVNVATINLEKLKKMNNSPKQKRL